MTENYKVGYQGPISRGKHDLQIQVAAEASPAAACTFEFYLRALKSYLGCPSNFSRLDQ